MRAVQLRFVRGRPPAPANLGASGVSNSGHLLTTDASWAKVLAFSTQCRFKGCAGSGPWVQADLEDGLHQGGSAVGNPSDTSLTSRFVTVILKNNGTSTYALKGGNAQSGNLSSFYSGPLPPGFSPMHKQGAIVLGSGGDCCATNTNQSQGTFYEGAIVSGYPSDATDDAVQANVVGASYAL